MVQRKKKKTKRKTTKRKTGITVKVKRKLKKLSRTVTNIIRLAAAAVIIAVGIFIWQGCGSHKDTGIERQTVDSKEYNGIDVSKHQGKINWKKVAADSKIQFVYIKATEGATLTDFRYKDNIRKARKEGLKVGSYHYFIGRKSAKEQFDNFNRLVDKSEQDLIPVVDIELKGNENISRAVLQSRLKEFMDLVKDEYGVYPIIYSQYRFYNERLAPEFNKYYIFIARYSSNKPVLKGSGKYNIWQYTERGHIDGINGNVDLDRFANGTKLSKITLKK